MSAARRLKRLQDNKQRPQVALQLGRALAAVEQIKSLQGDFGTLEELKTLLQESQGLVERLTSDYQGISDELEIQRETFIRLLTKLGDDAAEENVRKVEAVVREEIVREREGT